jgi:hypothetical protein
MNPQSSALISFWVPPADLIEPLHGAFGHYLLQATLCYATIIARPKRKRAPEGAQFPQERTRRGKPYKEIPLQIYGNDGNAGRCTLDRGKRVWSCCKNDVHNAEQDRAQPQTSARSFRKDAQSIYRTQAERGFRADQNWLTLGSPAQVRSRPRPLISKFFALKFGRFHRKL